MEKSLIRKITVFFCFMFLFQSFIVLPVHADAAPVPVVAVFYAWPFLLVAVVVILAIFLYRKFRK